MFAHIHAVVRDLAVAVAGPRREFTCGDCERWRRCGLPPSKDCPVRLEQIARYGDPPPRRSAIIGCEGAWIELR
jgi:hypothetical protein